MHELLHLSHQVLDMLNYLATHVPWDAVLASGVLSGLLVGPKKLVEKWFKHNEQIMILVVGAAGLLVAGVNYLIHTPTQNPTIIAAQGLILAFMTQPFYFIVIKPVSRRLGVWFSAQLANASLLNDARSVLQPAAPAPVAKADPAALAKTIDVLDLSK